MNKEGFKQARDLTNQGFYFDNLMKMAQYCRKEKDSERLVSAFILHHIFLEMAKRLGDRPVLSHELQKLEARYRTTINLSLETAMSRAPMEEQVSHLAKLINLFWEDETSK